MITVLMWYFIFSHCPILDVYSKQVHKQDGHVHSPQGHFEENRFFRSAVHETQLDGYLENKFDFWREFKTLCKRIHSHGINLKFGRVHASPGDKSKLTIFTFMKLLRNNQNFVSLKNNAANVSWFNHVFGFTKGPDSCKLTRMP